LTVTLAIEIIASAGRGVAVGRTIATARRETGNMCAKNMRHNQETDGWYPALAFFQQLVNCSYN